MSIFLKVDELSVSFRLNNLSFGQKIKKSLESGKGRDIGGKVIDANGHFYVEALKNISLDLKAGDRLGIVGSNGAGKSTLMRAIAGIIPPISGEITYSGHMLAAFSANGGIEQDISVEDNIFYRAALLGYTIENSDDFVEEILDWAEVPHYRHLPFRSLSPGMMARVGFALTTAFSCDILLIDEWIGVGDERFIKRARERWEQMVDRAGILVVCSHSEQIISNYCDKILSLKAGEVLNFSS